MTKELPAQIPLFREKAIEAKATSAYGSALLPAFSSARIASALSIAIVALLLMIVSFGSYTRKVSVTGQLRYDPPEARISTFKTGTVVESLVKNGDHVESGQTLMTLSTARYSGGLVDVDERIVNELRAERELLAEHIKAQSNLDRERLVALNASHDTAINSERTLQNLFLTEKRRLEIAQQNLERTENLFRQGYLAKDAVEKSQDNLLATTQQLHELETRLDTEQGRIQAAHSDIKVLPYQSAQKVTQLRGQISEIDRRIAEAEASKITVLRAPISGTVTNLTARVSQEVIAGETVAVIVPSSSKLYAEALIPSRSAGFVSAGMHVKLRYHAYPFEKFGQGAGVISHLDETATMPQRRGGEQGVQPFYLATIKIESQEIVAYGKPVRLREGLTFDANIRQESRRFYQWILDPIAASGMRL